MLFKLGAISLWLLAGAALLSLNTGCCTDGSRGAHVMDEVSEKELRREIMNLAALKETREEELAIARRTLGKLHTPEENQAAESAGEKVYPPSERLRDLKWRRDTLEREIHALDEVIKSYGHFTPHAPP